MRYPRDGESGSLDMVTKRTQRSYVYRLVPWRVKGIDTLGDGILFKDRHTGELRQRASWDWLWYQILGSGVWVVLYHLSRIQRTSRLGDTLPVLRWSMREVESGPDVKLFCVKSRTVVLMTPDCRRQWERTLKYLLFHILVPTSSLTFRVWRWRNQVLTSWKHRGTYSRGL